MAKKSFYVTAEMLKRRGACASQVARFIETFGRGRIVATVENVEKAIAAGICAEWPITECWWEAPIGSSVERAASELRQAAYFASPSELVGLYAKAAKLWAQIPARRA